MKKSWGLTEKILSGEKTIETRWYKVKYPPWDKINKGDTIFFKDSGEPVTAKATVSWVEQYSDLNDERVQKLLDKYAIQDLGTSEIPQEINEYFTGKKYCIVIGLKNPERVKTFGIDKSGYGAMTSWICVEDINKRRITIS